MVNCVATLNALAADYVALGRWIGVATANPGTTVMAANEISGGTPAYARAATTWSAAGTGVQQGSTVTINIPTGTVITYGILASAVDGDNMYDNCPITTLTFGVQSQMVATPTYIQT